MKHKKVNMYEPVTVKSGVCVCRIHPGDYYWRSRAASEVCSVTPGAELRYTICIVVKDRSKLYIIYEMLLVLLVLFLNYSGYQLITQMIHVGNISYTKATLSAVDLWTSPPVSVLLQSAAAVLAHQRSQPQDMFTLCINCGKH